jgi:hypothetical protein
MSFFKNGMSQVVFTLENLLWDFPRKFVEAREVVLSNMPPSGLI